MFSSKYFISDVNQVPSTWIFENYLGISQKLSGQNVRINSLFNVNDKTPSMYIYYNEELHTYKFKCFSTGKSGGPVDIMMYIWQVAFTEASQRIIKDYIDYLKTGKICDTKIIEHSKWKVDKYQTRGWTKNDAEFWSEYNIGSQLLEQHNVVPIDRYVMQKTSHDKNIEQEFTIVSKHIYGFFTKAGILYKIYQPKNREKKFIKICDYIQGYEQLQKKPVLIIASSLKDCMAIKSMNLNVDVIAPDSENTILHEDVIFEFKEMYESIVTIFDSDEAGISAMKMYEQKYKIPFCYLSLEKDIADIVKVHGVKTAMYDFIPKLHRAMDKYKQLQILDK